MTGIKTPYRYDFVGSFLRPQALKDAKAAYQKKAISQEEYDAVVNEEIAKVVAKQKELGYHVITDGEFRRTFWHLDFMWGFEGVAHENTGNGVRLMRNWQYWTIRIWWEKSRRNPIRSWSTLSI